MCLGVKAQNPQPNPNHNNYLLLEEFWRTDSVLYSVDICPMDSNAYYFYVGKSGTIYRGARPINHEYNLASLVECPTSNDLYKVKFANDSIGYIVGEKGTILKTVDGGLSWSDISIEMSYSLYDITTLGTDTCWISGGRNYNWYSEPGDSAGILMRTINGGLSWEIDSSYSKAVNKVLLINDSLAYMVNTSEDTSLLFVSIDLGDTFSQITSVSEVVSNYDSHKITDISYLDGKTRICMYPDARTYYSIDNGESWHNCSDYCVGHKLQPINECNTWSILYPSDNISRGEIRYIYAYDDQDGEHPLPFWSDEFEGANTEYQGHYTDFCKTKDGYYNISAIMSYFDEEQHVISSGIIFDAMITTVNKHNAEYISIYPNPTSSFFTISLSNMETEGFEYSIYDVMGRLVEHNIIDDMSVTIDDSNWKSGIYEVIIFKQGEMMYSEKIIKE